MFLMGLKNCLFVFLIGTRSNASGWVFLTRTKYTFWFDLTLLICQFQYVDDFLLRYGHYQKMSSLSGNVYYRNNQWMSIWLVL